MCAYASRYNERFSVKIGLVGARTQLHPGRQSRRGGRNDGDDVAREAEQ